ncbi:MAG: hypothetical protein WC292_01135 [Clostridia bacterium]
MLNKQNYTAKLAPPDILEKIKGYLEIYYQEPKPIEAQEKIRFSLNTSFVQDEHCAKPRKLSDYIEKTFAPETFSDMLLRLIDEKGLKDSQVYKNANIDRRLFSKIRSNRNYSPTKITIFSFALALHLSIDEAKDLLGVAGFKFNMNNKFDLILRYCIEEKIYNIADVNDALYSFKQNLLGC